MYTLYIACLLLLHVYMFFRIKKKKKKKKQYVYMYRHFFLSSPRYLLAIGLKLLHWIALTKTPLHWRHNDHDSVSNHQPHHCLLSRLFGRRSKKTSKLRVAGLCAGNSPGIGEFPAQMASNAENVSIWWRHHEVNSSSHQATIWLSYYLTVTHTFSEVAMSCNCCEFCITIE